MPNQCRQTSRVSPLRLYMAVLPMPGGTGPDGLASRYPQETTSYAYLDAVPGAYLQSGAARQTSVSQSGEHVGPLQTAPEINHDKQALHAEFARSPELQQAFVQWHAQCGNANAHPTGSQGSHKPGPPLHRWPEQFRPNED
ncbi:hypothetical protein H4R20_005772 [Coemansia guatemalensis]|uniref:Uncharacterized protein n=1 Tax=Coemansia guatemalensis TaxID=2761395 RepID=A0A9W8HNZ8_9FUNG|nr:hypothetical protein H4R20_005772 [Coemansia guatemalensis]